MRTPSMAAFLEQHSISLKASRVSRNPHMPDSENMDHWKVVLTCGNDRMSLYFSKGYGHHGQTPDVGEVLDCLASDAAGVDNARSFKDWCSEYGYDTDSRKAEKVYRTCQDQATRLGYLLGPSAYAALLWEVERL